MNLFSLFAVLLRSRTLRVATVMVVIAGAATGIVAVMGNRARRDNSRNRVLINHLADRVFQQDHELIKGLDLTLQLNTIHQINRNWNTFPTQCVQERILKDCPLAILFSLYAYLYFEPFDSEKLRTIRLNCTHSVCDSTNNL